MGVKRGTAKVERPKADPQNAKHVGAPMPGKVSSVSVSLGQTIQKGTRLQLESMGMTHDALGKLQSMIPAEVA